MALSAITLNDTNDETWYADTGATSHMTGDLGKLYNLNFYSGSDYVMVGNGATLPITHSGDSKLNCGDTKIILKNVLLAPQMKKKPYFY
ncbi:hypothetical protein SLEP1_g52200 [Rubroshorea leprosula]|uniref:Retrovirus-related Pol polyprotein from transposon TNT 1-94-like beta-barrel domain-containing protein n=1 Tax=Rubroshorea leprosula TaxID=152421 RepID=A0AAV5M6K6_9ROSI|nr:hypothetical protein SLEP1_g52200 [Rubroshorea leprosula]